jgi:hypothetical protein
MSMARPLLLSTAVYAVFTLALVRGTFSQLSTAILSDSIDPVLNAAILAWNATRIPLTDAWFQFPAFFPLRDVLTFTEHLLGLSIIASPLYWLTGNALLAYNLTVIATFVLNGMAMFVLVWRLTHSAIASLVAGFAYAFAPYRIAQIAHVQMLASFWAPVALLGLHEFIGTRERSTWLPSAGWLALFAFAWSMQGMANGYMLVFFSVFVGLWVAWFVIGQGRWRELALIAAAALVAALPLVPIILRFVDAHARYLLFRTPGEVVAYSADVSAVGCVAPHLAVWRTLSWGVCGGEGALFPGVTLLALCAGAGLAAKSGRLPVSRTARVSRQVSLVLLALSFVMLSSAIAVSVAGSWRWELGPLTVSASSVGRPFQQGVVLLLLAAATSPAIWRALRTASVPAFYLLAAATMWMFSWGPEPRLFGEPALAPGPYAWLMTLPGLDQLRVPARFWMIVLLCLCVAAGVLLARLLSGRRVRVAAAAGGLCLAGLVLDGWAAIPAAELPAPPPRADELRGRLVLTLPLGDAAMDAAAQLHAVEGGWTSINGYSGYDPPHYAILRDASGAGGSSVLSPFRSRGVSVIVHESFAPHVEMLEREPSADLVGSAAGQRQYVIPPQPPGERDSPASERLPIAAVSAACSTRLASFVLDGDSTTRWECGPQRPDQAITADFGEVRTLGRIVSAIGPYLAEYPRHLVIETSRDGLLWESAWDGEVTAAALEAVIADPRASRIVLTFPPRSARYVRLRAAVADGMFWSIVELEAWTG